MDVYNQFQELFDDFMEEFCRIEQVESTEFLQKLKESDSEDPKAAHYIRIIIASMEYNAFVKLMRQMRPRAERAAAAQHCGHRPGSHYSPWFSLGLTSLVS